MLTLLTTPGIFVLRFVLVADLPYSELGVLAVPTPVVSLQLIRVGNVPYSCKNVRVEIPPRHWSIGFMGLNKLPGICVRTFGLKSHHVDLCLCYYR